jgi:cysteine synthase
LLLLPWCCTNAQVAAAYGCRCFIAMPDDAAIEKAQLLQALGELRGGTQLKAVVVDDGQRATCGQLAKL